MIKNTSGQKIGAQMVSATDGSAFTGSVTVSVTGDAGTQATGSVGSGACTHEGNGFHTYAPAQAETNYDHIAFTFTGTGAVPVTVQVFTIAGDAFTRLGAPAGASHAADILAIDNLVDDLETRLTATRAGYLDNLSAGAVATASALTTVSGLVDDLESRLGTPSDFGSGATVAANLVDIENQTDDIGAAGAGLTALATAAELAKVPKSDSTVTWNATALASIQQEATDALNAYDPPTNAEMEARTLLAASYATAAGVSAVETDTQDIQGRLPAALVGGRMDATVDATGMESGAIDAILDDTIGDSTLTVRQALRVLVAGMAGKLSGAASTTITIRNVADTANVVVATVDADGNRSAVTVTP